MRFRTGDRIGFGRICSLLLLLAAISVHVDAQAGGSSDLGNTRVAPAQGEQSQSQSDLADAARRAREERERQSAKRSANSDAVSAMANELSEASDEDLPAPVGYRYYKFKQGDYAILVPADAEIEGRNSYGLKLLSSEAMGSRTIVILGDPIRAQGTTPLEILRNASKQYLPGCNGAVTGTGPPVNGHATGSVGYSMCPPLHNEIMGYVHFIVGDGFVVPIVCGYPYKAEDLDPNPHRPIATIVKKYDRERNGFRACDTIMPSVRFSDHGSQWQPKTAVSTPTTAVVTNALLNSDSTLGAGNSDEGSLGNFARAHRKTSAKDVLTELKHTAPGYSSYAFNYCSKDDCFPARFSYPFKPIRTNSSTLPTRAFSSLKYRLAIRWR